MSETNKNSILMNDEEVSGAVIKQELPLLRARSSYEISYEEMAEQQDKIESLLYDERRNEVIDIKADKLRAMAKIENMEGVEA